MIARDKPGPEQAYPDSELPLVVLRAAPHDGPAEPDGPRTGLGVAARTGRRTPVPSAAGTASRRRQAERRGSAKLLTHHACPLRKRTDA